MHGFRWIVCAAWFVPLLAGVERTRAQESTDAISREFTASVAPAPPAWGDAVSREFTVVLALPTPAMTDAVSREFTVAIAAAPPEPSDASSREFTVMVALPPPEAVDAVSREFTVVAPLLARSAASRKRHETAGIFEIPLPLEAEAGAGIECRTGGPTQLVFAFNGPVRASDGWLDGTEVLVSAGAVVQVTAEGDRLIAELAGVPNGACLRVTLAGLEDLEGSTLAGDDDVLVRVLHSDVNGDGLVASADITQVKSRSGQTANAGNFRYDVNADGIIASADITQVKSRSGSSADCP